MRNGLSADGKLYASPFYAESSFLMYRNDILEKAGVEMPAKPTWQEIATIAQKVNKPDMAGICLRGKPGWAISARRSRPCSTRSAAPGGRQPDGSIDKAMVAQPEFKQALDFYVNLVKTAGEKDAANASFNECLSQYKDGKVAMWYDATVAAGLLEASDSPVKGKKRLRARAGRQDGRLRLAVVVGAGDPEDDDQPGTGLEVRRVGDRPGLHQGSRAHDPGWLGVDPAGEPQVDL